MKGIKQRGTSAGLGMIAIALTWAVFDTMKAPRLDSAGGEMQHSPERSMKTRKRLALRDNSGPFLPKQEAGIAQTVALSEANPEYRPSDRRRGALLDDAELIQAATGKRIISRRGSELTERETLKALRLGISSAKPVTSLEEALAATDPDSGMLVPSSERAEAIRAASIRQFDELQLQSAYRFVENGIPPEGIPLASYRWLSDEIFIALRNQNPVPSDLVARLSDIAINPAQDPVLRDYALQHLGHYHEESGQNLENIEQTLWQATSYQEGTIAGTALLALNNALKDGRMVSDYALQDKALEILKTVNSEESKIAALEVLKGNRSRDVMRITKNLIISDEISIALKTKAFSFN